MSILKDQITLLRDFLKTHFYKRALLCAAVFFVTGVVGYLVGIQSPDTVNSVIEYFWNTAESNGVILEDGTISTFGLLANNWMAMLICAAYGFFPFMFLPVVPMVSNGFILGISAAMYHIQGYKLTLWLAGILPHGIAEFTAVFLSAACGIHLCICISRMIIASPNRTPIVTTLCDLLRVMLLLVAPLTIAAAFIEVYITPIVMSLFH